MLPILQTILAGLIGTAAMSAALYLIHWRGIVDADMIRAVGSLLTRREENAFPIGAAVHFASGVGFAFIYVILWSALPQLEFQHYLGLGALTGLAHGLVMSFVLVVTVAEHHPLPRFRQAGLGVAGAHLFAHVVYGVLVALVAGSYAVRLDILPKL